MQIEHEPVRPVQNCIFSKLKAAFDATHLQVLNESSLHNVPRGSETHFKVIVVSARFSGMAVLERHRLVNEALADELAGCASIVIKPCTGGAAQPWMPFSHCPL